MLVTIIPFPLFWEISFVQRCQYESEKPAPIPPKNKRQRALDCYFYTNQRKRWRRISKSVTQRGWRFIHWRRPVISQNFIWSINHLIWVWLCVFKARSVISYKFLDLWGLMVGVWACSGSRGYRLDPALIMERDESVPHMSASLWEVCLWKLKQLPGTETDSFLMFTQTQISPKKKIVKNIFLWARSHLSFPIIYPV